MLTKKKKLSKKEIKEDKLVSFYYKAYGYFEENTSRILIFAGALVVVALAVYFYINHKIETNKLAAQQLALVMDSYDSGNYLEAIEGKAGTNMQGLKKIVEEYGSSENGETAKIYLANSYNRLQKYDDALKYYKDYDGSIPIYKAAALAGQANYYAAKKDYEKAADLYRDAARVSESNAHNPSYLLESGINYMLAGNNPDAKTQFEKIRKDYKTSTAFRETDKYWAVVN